MYKPYPPPCGTLNSYTTASKLPKKKTMQISFTPPCPSLSSVSYTHSIVRDPALYPSAELICKKKHDWKLYDEDRALVPLSSPLLRPVKFLVHEVQQEIDIQLHVAFEQVHELPCFELRLEKVFDTHQSACAWHLDMASRAFNGEHANVITRYCDIDLVPVAHARPRNKDTLVR